MREERNARTRTTHQLHVAPPRRVLALLVFVAISVYPALNVFSVSLRPGNRLRSTDLAIIPRRLDAATTTSHLFTEQPFLRWLGNSLLVATVVTLTGVALASIGGYAFSRFKLRRPAIAAWWRFSRRRCFPPRCCCLPLYILVAKLHLLNTYFGLMVFYTSTALAVLHLADEGLLRHDSRVARRRGPRRWLQPHRRSSGA